VSVLLPRKCYHLHISGLLGADWDLLRPKHRLRLLQFQQTEGKVMSNRSIIIMVLVLISATAYLLLKGDGNIDMGGEKHGAEATHVEEAKKDAPAAAPAAPAAAPAADAKK